MAEPVAIQSGRPDDAQCYNCGGIGHWAVACPEPTRETPAGLEAWRNSSAGRQGNSRGQQPDGRRSAGAIVTKYPPPPPAGYGAHYSSAPGYAPQHGQYSGPSPPAPYPSQYHYPSDHGRPPPPGHGQHHYPPSSYAPSAENYSGHPHHQSYTSTSPRFAPISAPQNYSSYAYTGQENQPYAPSRQAYSGSFPKGAGGGQKRRHQRPTPSNKNSAISPPKTPSSQGNATSPAKPAMASLSLPLTHALPPKPPKSVHENTDHIRDQRGYKRKHDYQNRPKDIKDYHPGRGQISPPSTAMPHGSNLQNSHGGYKNKTGQNRPIKHFTQRRRSSAGSHAEARPMIQRQSAQDFADVHSHSTQESYPINAQEHGRMHNSEQSYWQNDNQLSPQNSHEPVRHKAADRASSLIKDISSLPPKPGTVLTNNNTYKPPDQVSAPVLNGTSRGMERLEQAGDRRKDGDFSDRSPYRAGPTSYQDGEDDGRSYKRARRTSGERSRSTSRYRDSDYGASNQRRRSRSLQRRSSPSPSSRSRNSSRSSRSSDLNSIEAELLGISTRRPSTDSEPRRRPERAAPPKAKSRKVTNSAFR